VARAVGCLILDFSDVHKSDYIVQLEDVIFEKVYFSKCSKSEENLKCFPIESDNWIDLTNLWLCLNGAPFEG
jgi:hypothetical protein